MDALTITEYTTTHPDFLPKPHLTRTEIIEDMIHSILPVIRDHGYIHYETLSLIAITTALYRGKTGDRNDPAIAASWMIEYLMEYVIQVKGVCALAQYTGNPEAARQAGLPEAYALIAVAWPELAPYCPSYTWDWTRSLFTEPDITRLGGPLCRAQKAVDIPAAKAFCIG